MAEEIKLRFNRFKDFFFNPELMSQKEAQETLVEQCLASGYIPMRISHSTPLQLIPFEKLTVNIAFVGKRRARKLYPLAEKFFGEQEKRNAVFFLKQASA